MAKRGEIDRFTKGGNDFKNVKMTDAQKKFIAEYNKQNKSGTTKKKVKK